jgi:hypothetical protein
MEKAHEVPLTDTDKDSEIKDLPNHLEWEELEAENRRRRRRLRGISLLLIPALLTLMVLAPAFSVIRTLVRIQTGWLTDSQAEEMVQLVEDHYLYPEVFDSPRVQQARNQLFGGQRIHRSGFEAYLYAVTQAAGDPYTTFVYDTFYTRTWSRRTAMTEEITAQLMSDREVLITFPAFTPGSGSRVEELLREHPESDILYVDLRGNPGGSLEELMQVAALLFPAGTEIVRLEGRNRQEVWQTGSQPLDHVRSITVFVDEQTASSAEILALSLLLHDRGQVVGHATAGKNVGQLERNQADQRMSLSLVSFRWQVLGKDPSHLQTYLDRYRGKNLNFTGDFVSIARQL